MVIAVLDNLVSPFNMIVSNAFLSLVAHLIYERKRFILGITAPAQKGITHHTGTMDACGTMDQNGLAFIQAQ
jgi:hypothetical protein